MNAAKMQEALIRKREAQQMKIEKSAAVHNYFDKWGKITSRFEHWTTPEYYKEKEEDLQKEKQNLLKQEKLEKRREKLKQLLEHEKEQYDLEVQEKSRPRSRIHSADILEQIKRSKIETENLKRRQELEKTLYERIRLGPDRDRIILESRTENQAIAKLNWLDRQVEMQLQNDEQRKNQQEREMRLQAEARKHEEFIERCNEMRKAEIEELRALQERHVQELKERENENHALKLQENVLKKRKNEIQEELEKLRLNITQRRDRIMALHNLRRIKMLLRERSEQVRRDLKQDIAVLDKIGLEWADPQTVRYLREKFQMQFDLEVQKQSYIEAMYESEAKQSLAKQEKTWTEEAQLREQQIRTLLEDCLAELESKIDDAAQRHKDLVNIRETHLNAIENANARLKALLESGLKEQQTAAMELQKDNQEVSRIMNGKNDSLHNKRINRPASALVDRNRNRILQTDYEEDLENKFNRMHDDFITTSIPTTPVPQSPLKIPEFGRKKIAWC
ncbi:trichoplein keratin filament-binding protein [Culicoides brevitarsis]|uniref:trichoplein keratin filament-binding protein n=1 Tax=Culicoides brevitarsis TaxID=469753 RepID=UPI00307C6469